MRSRILFTSHTMDPEAGGAERVLRSLLARAAARFEVHLAIPKEPPILGAAAALWTVHTLPAFRVRAGKAGLISAGMILIAMNLRMIGLLRRTRPSVIHVNSVYALYFSVLPALLARIPIVYHEHGLPSLRAESLWHKGFEALLRRVTRIIAITGAVRDELVEMGVPRHSIVVIWNGIEAADDEAAGSHSTKDFAHPELPTIGVIANLHRWKRQDLCIRALAELVGRGADVRLILVGAESVPDYARELRALCHELGVGARVEFAGFRRDAQALLRRMHCLVVASDSEPFGLVILEAMRAGVPVVAAAGGGVPEIVRAEVDGLLFPPGDSTALAGQLQRVLTDASLRARLIESGRRAIEERFSLDAQAERVFSEFEAVAQRRALAP